MTKTFFYCLLALGLGTVLAVLLADDPGYVLISFRNYSIEATLGTVLLSMVLVFLLLIGILWLLKIVNPLKLFKKDTWLFMFSDSNPRRASENGLQLLLMGYWQESYKLLVENAPRVDNPVANYLAASFAAFKRGDKLSCNYCLDQAEKYSSASVAGVRSLKAHLELAGGNSEQALAILLALNHQQPGSPFVLEQLRDIYLAMADWEKLAGLMPDLAKHNINTSEELANLQEKVGLFRLEKASSTDAAAMNAVWNSLPKTAQGSEKVIGLYIKNLISHGSDTEANNHLTRYLRKNWSDNLVGMLGFVKLQNPQKTMLLLEDWLKERPNNSVLLLTLGRLSLRNQLWGKARNYFENALKFSRTKALTAEINAELARLLENLGESDLSLACYHRAMELFENSLPELPMPTKPH